jgi:ParB-like chromosome segregation protein Spo0J
MSTPRISRAVPLEQLRAPETDVREHRDQDSIRSLAASMGDPSVGQLQDVLVHPVAPDELEGEIDSEQLHELHRDGHDMRIVDGETRRLAAEHLGWHSLDCTIVPEPPESRVIAQLDANTERISMTGFETCRALHEHYQETGCTLADMQDKTGYSPGHLSEVFSLFEAPECIQQAWQHPDHPVSTTDARNLRRLLTENQIERYAAAGGLDEEEAYDRALQDVRLMIDVQEQHELTATEFRKRCQRCMQESLQELSDSRTQQEKQADGQQQAAEQRARSGKPTQPPQEYCRVCGDESDRKIALNVCRSDYGMLSDMKAQGETLLEQRESPEPAPSSPRSDSGSEDQAVAAISDALDLPEEQAHAALSAIAEQAHEQ